MWRRGTIVSRVSVEMTPSFKVTIYGVVMKCFRFVYVYTLFTLDHRKKWKKFLENNRVESENLMSYYCWIKLQFIVSQRPINIIKIMLNHLQLLTQCITCKNWVILSLKFIIICTSTLSNKLVWKLTKHFFYSGKYSLFNE